MHANMLDVFSMVSGIDASYKRMERLCSDEEVALALHNLHVLLLKKRGVKRSDASGDVIGYSLTITKHYESVAKELKEEAKEKQQPGGTTQSPTDAKGPTKRAFAYVFRLMLWL